MKPIKSMKRLEALIITRIEKNGRQFFTKTNLQKSQYFFSKKIEFFRGLTWTIGKLKHLSQIFGCV